MKEDFRSATNLFSEIYFIQKKQKIKTSMFGELFVWMNGALKMAQLK